jgi:hypothetical protein
MDHSNEDILVIQETSELLLNLEGPKLPFIE